MKHWQQYSRLVVVALGVTAMVFTGCGDDDDDGGGGGGGEGAAITSDNVAAVQGALGTTMATAFAKGPGTHDGAHSGDVTVAIGKAAVQAINYSLDFDNYSDDGQIWVDGTINYSVDAASGSVSYTGDITISGAYSGSVQIDIQISGAGYTGSYTVNGETLSL
jgi:hypothetical protein